MRRHEPAPMLDGQHAGSRDEWLLSYYPLDDVWPMNPDGARVLADAAAWLRDRSRAGLSRVLRRTGKRRPPVQDP